MDGPRVRSLWPAFLLLGLLGGLMVLRIHARAPGGEIAAGLLVIALAFPRGPITQSYGSWDRCVF